MTIVVISLTKTAVPQIHQVFLYTKFGKVYATVFSKCIYYFVVCITYVDVHLLLIHGRICGGYTGAWPSHCEHDYCVSYHKSAAIIRGSDVIFFCDIDIQVNAVDDSVSAGHG